MLPEFFFFFLSQSVLILHIVKGEFLEPVGGSRKLMASLSLGFCHSGSQMEQSYCSICGSCWRNWRTWVNWLIKMTLWSQGWTCRRPRSQNCYSICCTGLEAMEGPLGRKGTGEPFLQMLSYIACPLLSSQSLCGRNPALHASDSPSTPHPQDWEQVHCPNQVGISEFIPDSFSQTWHCSPSGFKDLPSSGCSFSPSPRLPQSIYLF